MKLALFFLILAGTSAFAQGPGYSRDRHSETRGQRDARLAEREARMNQRLVQGNYSGMGLNFTVYGAGPFVCSAVESFSGKPQLGRGFSLAEARQNAEELAASYSNSHFNPCDNVRTISCEGSNSGRGYISIVPEARGTRITVEGPSLVECVGRSVFGDSRFVYTADASTRTEANALATTACSDGARVDPMHCNVTCTNLNFRAPPPARPLDPRIEIEIGGGRGRGRVSLPGRF